MGPACLLAAAVSAAPVPPAHGAACGSDNVSVIGSQAQSANTCRALDEVRAYFKAIGFEIEPRITIKFSELVYIATYDAISGRPTSRFQVSGFYDATRDRIEITSAWSRYRKSRRPWGLRWGHAIAHSILQHELTHMALRQALAGRYQRVSKPWIEFLAYAVQLDIMEPRLKTQVLNRYAGTKPFQFPENVNPFLYGIDPDEFGVRSYLYTQANGGRDFIRRIIKGEVSFSTDEILWTR